jgi:hypothetical protein
LFVANGKIESSAFLQFARGPQLNVTLGSLFGNRDKFLRKNDPEKILFFFGGKFLDNIHTYICSYFCGKQIRWKSLHWLPHKLLSLCVWNHTSKIFFIWHDKSEKLNKHSSFWKKKSLNE